MKKALLILFSLSTLAVYSSNTSQITKLANKKVKEISQLKQTSSLRSTGLQSTASKIDSTTFVISLFGMDMQSVTIFQNNSLGYPLLSETYTTVADMGEYRDFTGNTTYTYNSENKVTEMLSKEYDDMTSTLVNSEKDETIYLTNDTIIENFYIWDDMTTAWNLDSTSTYIHTETIGSNGLVAQEIYYYFNEGEWEKYDYTYDSYKNMEIELVTASTDGVNYENAVKQTYIYNTTYNYFTLEYNTWNGSAWESISFMDSAESGMGEIFGDLFSIIEDMKFYYTLGTSTDSNNAVNSKLAVYPNPTTDGFYVNTGNVTASISLLSLSGNKLISKEISGKEYISVNGLEKGTYILILNQAGTLKSEKLIIE